MRTTIGVDIDGVLLDTSRKILENLGIRDIEGTYKKLYSHDIAKTLGMDRQIVKKAVDKALLEWCPTEIKGAKEGLKWLQAHFNVVLITTRRNSPSIVAMTYNSIYNLSDVPTLIEFKPADTILIQDWYKSQVIRHYDIPIMIEDNPKNITDILTNSFADVLIFDKPWNQGDWVPKESLNRVNRVYTWKEIKEWFILNYKGVTNWVNIEEVE